MLFETLTFGVAIYEPTDDGQDFIFVDLNLDTWGNYCSVLDQIANHIASTPASRVGNLVQPS